MHKWLSLFIGSHTALNPHPSSGAEVLWCASVNTVSLSTGFLACWRVNFQRGLDRKEGWASKNWCFKTVVLEMTLESPLDSKEIKVHPKGNQPWILIGRTDAEAEAPISWSPDVNSQLIGKDPEARKDWRQKEKRASEEMGGWHHWCNGNELGETLGDGDGQGGLVCCSSCGLKESDTTQQLNWTELNWMMIFGGGD